MANTKTHKVLDLVYYKEEENEVFAGTYIECIDWKSKQGFGYQIVPLTPDEIKVINQNTEE